MAQSLPAPSRQHESAWFHLFLRATLPGTHRSCENANCVGLQLAMRLVRRDGLRQAWNRPLNVFSEQIKNIFAGTRKGGMVTPFKHNFAVKKTFMVFQTANGDLRIVTCNSHYNFSCSTEVQEARTPPTATAESKYANLRTGRLSPRWLWFYVFWCWLECSEWLRGFTRVQRTETA